MDQWRKVIWSDEASVARGSGKGKEWVFGTPDQKWDRDKLQENSKGKAFRIMIWGAFWGPEDQIFTCWSAIGNPKKKATPPPHI